MVVMGAQMIKPLGFVRLLLTVVIFVQVPVETDKHGESDLVRKLDFAELCI